MTAVTKLKAFADDKLTLPKMTVSLFDIVENTVGKGENVVYQHFLLFPQCFPYPAFSPFPTLFSKASFLEVVNPLPNNKILDRSKLKALAGDKITVIQKLKFGMGRVENIVGKGENPGY